MRIALGIEYDGTAYNGWQRQKAGIGVQVPVEKAVARVADEAIEVVCAGRTDTGVHASGQVVHFDSDAKRKQRNWLLGINSELPDDINVCWVAFVDEAFHARYSAASRTYRYLILNRSVRSALSRNRAWWILEPLDDTAMQEGANLLLGEHDFSALRAAGCQSSTPVRNLERVEVSRNGEWLVITVTANAYLKHMVRNMTGVLVAIGKGDEKPAWAGTVLESRDRRHGGVAAPAHGLTLVAVTYPPEFKLPTGTDPGSDPGSVPGEFRL